MAYVGAEGMLEGVQKTTGWLKLRSFKQPMIFWALSNISSAPT